MVVMINRTIALDRTKQLFGNTSRVIGIKYYLLIIVITEKRAKTVCICQIVVLWKMTEEM